MTWPRCCRVAAGSSSGCAPQAGFPSPIFKRAAAPLARRDDPPMDRGGRPPMTTCDDDRREPVTRQEVISTYGQEYYEAALGYGRHHYDLDGEPCWLPHEWDTVVGLLAFEGEARS